MANINLNPELARLTRRTAEQQALPVGKQAARALVEQAVMELDPELNFLLDNDESLASVDALVRAANVNDIVVNGRRIDVNIIENGEVTLPMALTETAYVECGSLVVQMDGVASGSIVGYVEPQAWQMASQQPPNSTEARLRVNAPESFDLAGCLQRIQAMPGASKSGGAAVKAEQVLQFVRDRHQLPLDVQRNVISAAMANAHVRETIAALDNFKPDQSPRILRDSSTWEARVARITNKLSDKFPKVSRDYIEKAIRETAQKYGGQPDAPGFKENLSKRILKEQLLRRASGAVKEALSPFVDSIAAGKNAADAVKGFVKDKVAADVAQIIKDKRNALERFSSASVEEIGFAFQQLAVQPAYATHSQSETGGVEAINEALELYEAAEVVESLMDIDFDQD